MKNYKIKILIVAIALFNAIACTKEKKAVYEVNEVTIKGDNNPKVRSKTTLEFISIAYQDILGATVSTAQLSSLSIAYTAFGDKKLIEDMIIKNLLNEPGAIIPTKASMTADPLKFVDETIKKIFNRNPNEYEKYYFTNLITTNTNVTPEVFYYALMTSEEYRYY